jgi:hypothetical protein
MGSTFGSKSFKTWILLDLALSVACGVPWLGFNTTKAKVLYCNFEIQSEFMQDRVKAIEKAKDIKYEVYVWRNEHAATAKERERMANEADYAFRQAVALCPYSPEAIFRCTSFLISEKPCCVSSLAGLARPVSKELTSPLV